MTQFTDMDIEISPGQKVSAALFVPENAMVLLILAHGAGANMRHVFLEMLSDELAKQGIGTLRFNFPYMEKGRRIPDPPAIATKAVGAAIRTAYELYPNLPLIAGGKSFGGRMSSEYAAQESLPYLKGLVFFGFPLHPDGKPSTARAQHLQRVKIPMLFLQGSRDN